MLDVQSTTSLRALNPTDGRLLAGLAAHLSPESRRRRFMTWGGDETGAWVARLLIADQTTHLVECLTFEDTFGEVMVGLVELVRIESEPHLAEFAVAISDLWQELGAAALLTDRLAVRSLEVGIDRWRTDRFAWSAPVARLLDRVGSLESTHIAHGIVTTIHRLDPSTHGNGGEGGI